MSRIVVRIWPGKRLKDRIVLAFGSKQLIYNEQRLRLRPMDLKILLALSGKEGVLTHLELGEAVFGDDPSGGPDRWADMLKIRVHELRKALTPFPLRIETWWGVGYSLVDDSPRVTGDHSVVDLPITI